MAEKDELSLEININSTGNENVDKLADSLERLDGDIDSVKPKISSLSRTFSTLANSVAKIDSTTLDTLSRMSSYLSSLTSSAQGLGDVASNIKSFASAMNSLSRASGKASSLNGSNFDLSGVVNSTSSLKQLSELSDTLGSVKSLGTSISTLSNGLSKLNNLNLTTTTSQMTRLNPVMRQLKETFDEFGSTSETLKTVSSSLYKLSNALDKLNTSSQSSNLNLDNMTFNVNNYSRNAENASGTTSNWLARIASGQTDIRSFAMNIKSLAQPISNCINVTNDYIETLNLYQVALGDSAEKGWDFLNQLSKLGVDMNQSAKMQASFYDLASSLGLSANNAYTLSEQFTKLAYDYSSFYNLDVNDAFQKLQSGIVGTVEPMRRLGKDISETRLKQTALNLGITESVSNMTQAEKTQLRFIAIMEQSGNALNDMERTIDAPANAIRVLKGQFTMLAREIGGFVIPVLSAILPYLIAIAKFARYAIQALASLVGVKLTTIDFNKAKTSVSGVNSGLKTTSGLGKEIANNTGKTSKGTKSTAKNLKDSANNAKKLRDYMLGIDELNVLNKDTGETERNGTGGSGSGGVGGVGSGGVGGLGGLGDDLDLSKYGYNDILKNIKSKADGIYKSFMKWRKPLLIAAGILAGMFVVGKIVNFIRQVKGLQKISNIAAGASGIGFLAHSIFDLAGTGGIIGGAVTAVVGFGDAILSMVGIVTGSTVVAGLTGLAVGIGAVIAVIGGVKLAVDEATKPSVESIDVLNYACDETKEKLKPVISSWEKLQSRLDKINFRGVIKDSDITYIQKQASKMKDSILSELDSDKNSALKNINSMKGLKSANEQTLADMKKTTEDYYNNQSKTVEDAYKKIEEITNKYKGKNSPMSAEDQAELEKAYDTIGQIGVKAMSKSEKEQNIILARMKNNRKNITVKSGEEVIQEAKKNYKKQKKEADDWYGQALIDLETAYTNQDGTHKKGYKQAKETIEKSYDEMKNKAKDTYDDIINNTKRGMGDSADQIDWSTGKIKTKWQVFTEGLSKGFNNTFGQVPKIASGILDDVKKWFNKKGDEITKAWHSLWRGIEGIGVDFWKIVKSVDREMNRIKKAFVDKFNDIGREFNKFFNDPIGYTGRSLSKIGSKLLSSLGISGYSLDINSKNISPQKPIVTKFARGGFVPQGGFISPNRLWTAGESGRELIGQFQGRQTVMPLENTGFVEAIYNAVREGVTVSMQQNQTSMNANFKVYLDSREIRKANVKQETVQSNGFIKKK